MFYRLPVRVSWWLAAAAAVSAGDAGPLQVVVRVQDVDGHPFARFEVAGLHEGLRFPLLTDANGMAVFSVPSSRFGDVGIDYNHYDSFKNATRAFYPRFPWVGSVPMRNPDRVLRTLSATMTFRAKLDPRPMRVVKESKPLPPGRGPWGFDLWMGDWVAPHGRGTVRDLEIAVEFFPIADRNAFDTAFTRAFYTDAQRLDRKFGGVFAHSTTTAVRFLGAGNGVIPFRPDPAFDHRSYFIHPYVAPDGGYATRYTVHIEGKPDLPNAGKSDIHEWDHIFRIRTPATSAVRATATAGVMTMRAMYGATQAPPVMVVRQDGALVGKFIEPISYHPGYQAVRFRYYLNPDPLSRSLEYNGVNLATEKGQRGEVESIFDP